MKENLRVAMNLLIFLGIIGYMIFGVFTFGKSLRQNDINRKKYKNMQYQKDSLQAEYYKTHINEKS